MGVESFEDALASAPPGLDADALAKTERVIEPGCADDVERLPAPPLTERLVEPLDETLEERAGIDRLLAPVREAGRRVCRPRRGNSQLTPTPTM